MYIFYSNHAKQRLVQRGISRLEIEFILRHPKRIIKSKDNRMIAYGITNNRPIKIVFIEKEKYIKIITVI